MSRILIISEDDRGRELSSSLSQKGYTCTLASRNRRLAEYLDENDPDLAMISGVLPGRIDEMCRQIKRNRNVPILAVLDTQTLSSADGYPELVDDFVTRASPPEEVQFRVQRLLGRKTQPAEGDQIRASDLVIDIAKCEVTVDGKPIMLTFKEYQLLKFLAGSPGRVFTREALLNKVWGYEYYGGDRTVDVHIKRLRSKIEDASHSFVETVRNIGYRFRDDL